MKLLYVYQTLARYGGVERVLADKINYMANHYGYDIYMLTRDQGSHIIPFPLAESVHYEDLGIRLHTQYAYKGVCRLLKKIQLQILYEIRVRNKIREIQPDIIIGTDVMPARTLLRHKGNAKLVIESHSMFMMTYADKTDNPLKLFLRRLAFRAFRKSNVLVSLTKGDAEDWRNKNHNKRIIVIPNVVNLNKTKHYSAQTSKQIIFVGRFTKLKGIPLLIEIWRKIQLSFPEWTLEFYGDGEEKDKYVPIMSSLNIHVHEPIKNIHEQYCESSILILTSICESFSLVIPEAMSCGLPVVSFDCPYGPRDIITDGEDGFLIPQYDVDLFVEKLSFLIDNERVRREMSKRAILSSQKFSPGQIMPKWKDLFEALIKS